MALNNDPTGHPDHKPVYRRGASETETDVNVGTTDNPVDMIDAGDYDSGPRNTGGAEAIAGEFETDDGNAFNVEIDWLDANEDVVATHDPPAAQGVTGSIEFAWRVRSDRWRLRVEDASGAAQNRIRGSANTH